MLHLSRPWECNRQASSRLEFSSTSVLFSKCSPGRLESLFLPHGVIAKERISGCMDNASSSNAHCAGVSGWGLNFPGWSLSVVSAFLWFQLSYGGMELGKSSLSFRMWTGGRSSACRLQQSLNSQGLARKQSGRNWPGPPARAPTEQELSRGLLPGPLLLNSAWVAGTLLVISPESMKQTG